MQILVVETAEGDGKFVTDLPTQGSRLGKLEVMGIGGFCLQIRQG